MWCTFASQQLKLKRQLFISYHLFSASCPPLSGMLPGNIYPGFYITYLPITANGSSHNEPLLTEGGSIKISVPISIWMKRQINEFIPNLVLKRSHRWKKTSDTHVSPKLVFCAVVVWMSSHSHFTSVSRFLSWFPPSAQFVTSSHYRRASWQQAKLWRSENAVFLGVLAVVSLLAVCVYVCGGGCDEFALESNGVNLGRMNA